MPTTLLRRALLANALFSSLFGFLFLGFGGVLASWLGAVSPVVLRLVGVGLLAFGGMLLWESRRAEIHPVRALLATAADLGWVVGSVVLLAVPFLEFTTGGRWAIALVALVVLTFAILQLAGLRALTRNRRQTTDARSSFEIRRRVAAPPEAVWALVRALDRIGEFYPVLRSVEVSGLRESARRTCENHRGERWSEEVIAWDERERALTLRFDADAPDFPFPMREMIGGWEVNATGDGSEVVIWYEYSVRGGLLGEFLAPLVAHGSRKGMTATIANMEAEARRLSHAAA